MRGLRVRRQVPRLFLFFLKTLEGGLVDEVQPRLVI
jgi:hypothetical protein